MISKTVDDDDKKKHHVDEMGVNEMALFIPVECQLLIVCRKNHLRLTIPINVSIVR